MLNKFRNLWLVVKWVYYSFAFTLFMLLLVSELHQVMLGLLSVLKNTHYYTSIENSFINRFSSDIVNNLKNTELVVKYVIYSSIAVMLFFATMYLTGGLRLLLKILWIKNSRDFLMREKMTKEKIKELLTKVIDQSNKINQKQFKVEDFKIRLFNSEEANCWIYADKTIVMTVGMIDKYSNDEEVILGVLSHELGHAFFKDLTNNELSLIASATSFLFAKTLLVVKTYFNYKFLISLVCLQQLSRYIPLLHVILVPLYMFYLFFGFVVLLPTLVVTLVFLIIQFVFISPIDMFFSKQAEYRADKFASKINKDGLLTFLYDDIKEESTQYSIKKYLYATHPTSYKRIKKLESL